MREENQNKKSSNNTIEMKTGLLRPIDIYTSATSSNLPKGNAIKKKSNKIYYRE
jgi:hypothetical protein